MTEINKIFEDYFEDYIESLKTIYAQTEQSGRTFLQNLLENFTKDLNLSIVHEPKRDNTGKGSPDFKFEHNDTIIGFLENKKIGENLDVVLKSEQIKKYKSLTDNLIVTDYLRWIWIFEDKVVYNERLCTPLDLTTKNFKLNPENCTAVKNLITDFLSQKPQMIVKAVDLAEKLAKPTRVIKKGIIDLLADKNIVEDKKTRIHLTYDAFKSGISEHITPDEFADAFAQTFTYSLFLTKINLTTTDTLTLENIKKYTPQSFSLIKDILLFIDEIDNYPELKPYVTCVLHIINYMDSAEIIKDLQSTKDEFEDPYIHFYENFLSAYDKQKRKDLGVWYTPKPIVQSIISMIDDILCDDFELPDGLASDNLKILDFACGTGTFLHEIYEQILDKIPANSLNRTRIIQNHILKNIYGFELLIPAYAVAHLKLSLYLKDNGYALTDKDRIPVYFTNTLEIRNDKQINLSFQTLFPAMTAEGLKAQAIKDDNAILVITGNPPYNVKSQNVINGELKKFHDTYKPKDEKNINSLNDDYIKFIAFAHQKIKLSGKGIFGLIVNNSFLRGLTHRGMRNKLLADFDRIYIINLYGGGVINDPKDENVFAIKQNVCIAIFVKNEQIKTKGIFYHELIGKRLDKFKAVKALKRSDFSELKIAEFNKSFKKTAWGKNRFVDDLSFFYPIQNDKILKKYGTFIGVTEIFDKYNSGIKLERDKVGEFAVSFTPEKMYLILQDMQNLSKQEIQEKYNVTDNRDWKLDRVQADIRKRSNLLDNIKPVMYRPFDIRYTDYTTDKSQTLGTYLRQDFNNHMIKNKDNIGISFVRNDYKTENYNYTFISKHIIDLHLLGGQAYFAPLYLYSDDLDSQKRVNFKPEFARFLRDKLGNPSPESVLAYIYGILHIPHFRIDYLDYLKIDFPRIPFDVDIDYFNAISKLGQDLINSHTMKVIPKSTIGEPSYIDKANMMLEKVDYNPLEKRIYFNKNSYFDNVSQEIWDYTIDGYNVLDKYLKSRENVDMTNMVIDTQNVIKSIDFTIKTCTILDTYDI